MYYVEIEHKALQYPFLCCFDYFNDSGILKTPVFQV